MLFTDDFSGQDEFGAFSVEVADDVMVWQREEEGQQVFVYLRKIEEVPVAPWDQIGGMWTLDSEGMAAEELDSLPFDNLFFRWDHIVVANRRVVGKETERGIWQIHAHRPSLWLVFDGADHPLGNSHWNLSFEDGQLVLRQEITGDTKTMRFTRA